MKKGNHTVSLKQVKGAVPPMLLAVGKLMKGDVEVMFPFASKQFGIMFVRLNHAMGNIEQPEAARLERDIMASNLPDCNEFPSRLDFESFGRWMYMFLEWCHKSDDSGVTIIHFPHMSPMCITCELLEDELEGRRHIGEV